ncbi:MAG: hypothetical protein KKH61_20950 [Gammaproteobacteria bacterium]|nr:hypothetical protein [Gammaproteobacteria bacterium]
MKPIEQEKLFKKVRAKFPKWSNRRASGYVHGVNDGMQREEPRRVYVRGFGKRKEYAIGYIYGFIDAYGIDVFYDSWINDLAQSIGYKLDYRWWTRA